MGQHQDRQAEIGFEPFEVFHEVERYGSVFGTAAQAGDVIDNEHRGVDEPDLILDAGEDVLIVIGVSIGHFVVVVELGTVKIVGEVVIALRCVAVAPVELFCAELKIDIKHFGRLCVQGKWGNAFAKRYAVADLCGQYGFANVGIGKEDTEFAPVPKLTEKHFRGGLARAEFHPAVAGFDNEGITAFAGNDLFDLAP